MATSTKKAASKKTATKAAAESTKEEVGKTGPSAATDAKANPMSDPESHAVSPSEMAALRPGAAKDEGKAPALTASDTATAERLESESADRRAEEDNSIAGRLARSGLVLNEPQGSSDRWVGESIQKSNDPARLHLKTNCRVTPISDVRPWTGLRVEPIGGGEPFTVPEELGGKDATPANWLALTNPATGKSLISE